MILLKSRREIECLQRSNQIVAATLKLLEEHVEPDVTTLELDRIAEQFILRQGAVPAFKGYRGFPRSLCTSINSEVVHGIPSGKRVLREGDILSIDVGVVLNGYVGDAAVTLPVGQVSVEANRLISVTRECLDRAIGQMVADNRLSDISYTIQSHAENYGYSVVQMFAGHGIGRSMHEDPEVPNYGLPGRGIRLRPGLVLAIEPMVNEGSCEVVILDDQWTAVTSDGRLSAHFEHSIAVTEDGPIVLSRLD